MRAKQFILPSGHERPESIHHLLTFLNDLDEKPYQVTISTQKEARSLQQLRGLFGNWFKFLSESQHLSINYLHQWMKAECLEWLYIEDPQTPEQEQWVELLAKYQEEGNQKKLKQQAARISLKWISSTKQMAEYMGRVEQFWADRDVFLPEMDRFRRIKQNENNED